VTAAASRSRLAPEDWNLLHAVADMGLTHELRWRIVRYLYDHPEATPKVLAEEADGVLENVAYHVRALRAAGVLELVRREHNRGRTRHWYRLADPARATLHEIRNL
jgi:predicted ArsR family transcriptional regulator